MENLGPLRILALSGGEWVIYLLLACSVLTVAVIGERWLAQRRERQSLKSLREKVLPLIEEGRLENAARSLTSLSGSAAAILSAALRHAGSGAAAAEERVAAARALERKNLEQRLLILGTLGNNAPFIGLFGTVLGVIKAFQDLAQTAAGPEAVMQGLSEALVATAVGLLVAIPAVMAYNYFMKRISDILVETDAMVRLVMAGLKQEGRALPAGK
jgi:biopolymer transport protein ExbB